MQPDKFPISLMGHKAAWPADSRGMARTRLMTRQQGVRVCARQQFDDIKSRGSRCGTGGWCAPCSLICNLCRQSIRQQHLLHPAMRIVAVSQARATHVSRKEGRQEGREERMLRHCPLSIHPTCLSSAQSFTTATAGLLRR